MKLKLNEIKGIRRNEYTGKFLIPIGMGGSITVSPYEPLIVKYEEVSSGAIHGAYKTRTFVIYKQVNHRGGIQTFKIIRPNELTKTQREVLEQLVKMTQEVYGNNPKQFKYGGKHET